jgi:addiction module RelE/StbE family toxin
MYRLVLTTRAEKDFDRLPKKEQIRVAEAFELLRENPLMGKKLQGDHKGQRSLRVWPYRIVYVAQQKVVTIAVLKIGHRQGVYK